MMVTSTEPGLNKSSFDFTENTTFSLDLQIINQHDKPLTLHQKQKIHQCFCDIIMTVPGPVLELVDKGSLAFLFNNEGAQSHRLCVQAGTGNNGKFYTTIL